MRASKLKRKAESRPFSEENSVCPSTMKPVWLRTNGKGEIYYYSAAKSHLEEYRNRRSYVRRLS